MTKDKVGNEIKVHPVTAQQILARTRERKAKSTLFMAISDEHLARFHGIKDAKTLWAAIKTRFGGNAESKKMQKNVLKQQFEKKIVSNSEGLDKSTPKLDKEDLEKIDQEDSKEMDLKWQVAMLSIRVKRFYKKTRKKLKFNGKEPVGFYKNKVECFNCHKRGHFARDCRSARNSGNRSRDARNAGYRGRYNGKRPTKEENAKALVVHDGLEEEVTETVFDNRSSDEENSVANDRFKKGEGYHAVPPLLTWNYMPPKPDQSFVGLDDSIYKFKISETITSLAKDEKDAPKTSTALHSRRNSTERVNTTGLKVVSAVKGNEVTALKTSAGCVWRPRMNAIEQLSKDNGWICTHQALKYKGIVDSGCSRHMIGNKAYLADYQKIHDGDETSKVLKPFITAIENQINKNVKVIRYDNRTKFKNKDLDEFCGMKGIKREYSNARIPQQNRVAERKSRIFIEADRTMLADSLLPVTFWAEAVNTACYVLNRALVTKTQNKTLYELLNGRTPRLDFMKPFSCPVTILNTLDTLGKFDGKADEGFLIGYFVTSKAFKVFNTKTRKVEENLHVRFLENKPNIAHIWGVEEKCFMVIDKNWTLLERREKAFYTGFMKFVDDCKPLVNSAENIKCPCYKTLVLHDELNLPPPSPVIDNTRQPQMSDMIALLDDLSYIPLNNEQNEPTQRDIGETSNEPTQAKCNEFEELYASANKELYLEFFQHVFPTMKGYKLPLSYYAIKKTFKTIGLGYESIHARVNDCFLFRGDNNKDVHLCPVCKTSGWKDNNTPRKKVPKKPGKMQHPVDGRAWKNFDTKYPNFAKEPRNVRLGLAADGFNPFGNFSQAYSMWPVILTTYNLPSWLCIKESSFMLTLLIPDPKSLGKDIDVYLRPLIDDLKVLWALKGVETVDVATGQKFNMRAMVLWTINDFPARSSLCGWIGKGYKACPTCNEDTPSVRVLGKTTYVCHKRILKNPHKWRMSLEFNGEIEDGDPPRKFDRDQIQAQLARLPTRVKGKHPSYGGVKIKYNVLVELNWTKRSIFYELYYWHHQGKTRLEKVGHSKWLVAWPNKKREVLEASGCQYLPDGVAKPIIELCSFFKQICSVTLMEDDMLKVQSTVVDILCNLELIYPPAFFDIMIHLIIHLPIEALEDGPIRPRWMFLFERFIKKLKGYLLYKAKPEGSIAEGYVAEEALIFSSHYFRDVTTKFNLLDRNVDPPRPTCQLQIRQRYVDIDSCVSTTSELFTLACEPTPTPISVNSCVVNGVRFVMHSRDERRTTQNSGICSPGGKDEEMYYGQLQEILEFLYFSFKVVLFRVKWFDNTNEVHKAKHLVLRNNMTQILTKEEDPDVIHFDNSSDLPLSTSLNDLDNATLHIDGQSTEVDAPPDIIDLDEDDDIIDDEDALPYDLTDSDDEDLVNVDDDDGVDVVYSSEKEDWS
nr:hypothetical protein [Tanacetum cinerariifolium]